MEATMCHANLSDLFEDCSVFCSSSQEDSTVDGDRDVLSECCSVCQSAPISNMWWVKRHELRIKFVMSISMGANSSQTLFTASSTSCLLTRHPAVRLWYNPAWQQQVNQQTCKPSLIHAYCKDFTAFTTDCSTSSLNFNDCSWHQQSDGW